VVRLAQIMANTNTLTVCWLCAVSLRPPAQFFALVVVKGTQIFRCGMVRTYWHVDEVMGRTETLGQSLRCWAPCLCHLCQSEPVGISAFMSTRDAWCRLGRSSAELQERLDKAYVEDDDHGDGMVVTEFFVMVSFSLFRLLYIRRCKITHTVSS